MVISRDRKKVKLEETSSPAVKETNWNFLVIFLSTIMVLIGVPSMFGACFLEPFMQEHGIMIFLICASLIAFLVGFLYCYSAFILFKIPFSGFVTQLSSFIIALGTSFIPVTIYYMFNNQLEYASICVIIVSVIYLIEYIILYFITGHLKCFSICFTIVSVLFCMGEKIMCFIPPTIRVFFKKLFHLWQFGLIFLPVGAIIYSIGILLSFHPEYIIIGSLCVIIGFLFVIFGFVLISLSSLFNLCQKIKQSTKCCVK